MVDRNLIRSLDVSEEEIEKHLSEALGTAYSREVMDGLIEEKTSYQPGSILTGRVVNVIGNDVTIEVGLKSEGTVDIGEFGGSEGVEIGQEVEVLLEEVESSSGLVVLSKYKADRIRGWEYIVANKSEGDVVSGVVTRKIKGGLLVDVGVPTFLPASQVDIRRPGDIGEFVGKEIEAEILKIDKDRRNVIISRRKLMEDRRSEAKTKLLAEIAEGQIRKGVVRNIAEFGAFVDLGGIDGLLHITDMSWGRVGHPSDVVKTDQEIEVVVLSVDLERGKISLGLKQKTPSPWQTVEEKYPVGTRTSSQVVTIMPYGAFVKIEEGLEGLVHISEMSWTRRVNHPSEMVKVGDEIDVVVLAIDQEKQELSLGMKQVEGNPWAVVKEKYPPGTVITGVVRSVTTFGAFVEIEPGIDGMLHISDMSWTKRTAHPSEVVKKGREIQCVILTVDEEKMRVSLGIKQLTEDPWLRTIPEHYVPGQVVKGKVTKLTNFGAFVELEEGLEGLLHISEMADHKISSPKDVVQIDQEVEVKILSVGTDDRKIRLSLKRAQWGEEEAEAAEQGPEPVRRRGGLVAKSGLLGKPHDNIIQTVRKEDVPDQQKHDEQEQDEQNQEQST